MAINKLKRILLHEIETLVDFNHRMLCKRMLEDVNQNHDKWSGLVSFQDLDSVALTVLLTEVLLITKSKTHGKVEVIVDLENSSWGISPLTQSEMFEDYGTILGFTIISKLFEHLAELRSDKSRDIVDGMLVKYYNQKDVQSKLSEMHLRYSDLINRLFYDLVESGNSVRVLLTEDGMAKLNTKSNYITLTSTSQKGFNIDTSTGLLQLDISINGDPGWRSLETDDYNDVVVAVLDHDDRVLLAYHSLFGMISSNVVSTPVTENVDYTSNVVQFKRK